ncbi:MAG: response regulator [Candidatus Delongbacteria bacterium]|nr:response regulator [Candidatus Delongbacteria bacterium]MBN2836593.1 response regulator [Candidatus Delongbacteria bacterium]
MKKVIIVEDDRSFSDLVKTYLMSLNSEIKVTCVDDVYGFIRDFVKETPDIILLDILLPDINGYTLLQFLRKLKCDSKIYIMSGINDEMISFDKNIKIDGFLHKPFELEDLKRIVLD